MTLRIVSSSPFLYSTFEQELGRDFDLELEGPPSGRYVIKVRPGTDPSPLMAHLTPMAPPIETDPALDVDYELHLDSPEDLLRRWHLHIRAPDDETLDRVRSLAATIGLEDGRGAEPGDPSPEHAGSTLFFGGAPKVLREAIRWHCEQLGLGPIAESKAWPDFDRDIVLHIVAPADPAYPRRKRYHVEVVTDSEPDGADLCRVLADEGFRARLLPRKGLQRFQMSTGSLRDDEDGLDASELRVIVQRFLVHAGLASPAHPLLQKSHEPEGIHPRIELPAGALRSGKLRPWKGDHPQRFRVRLHTDDRARVQPLVAALQSQGFGKVKVFTRSRPEPEPVVLLRLLRASPESKAALERAFHAVAALGIPTPAFDDEDVAWEMRHEESDVEIHLPFGGRSDGVTRSYRHDVLAAHATDIQFITCGRDDVMPPVLAAALQDIDVAIPCRSGPEGRPAIMCGGASEEVIRVLQQLVRETLGLELPIDRCWPEFDDDIWVSLGDASGPLEVEAPGPADEPEFAAWEAWSEAGPSREVRPFVEDLGAQIRLGETVLDKVDSEGSTLVPGRAPFDTFCIDATTAATLDHITMSVARAEPCLLEGPTSTSKTSSILFVASLIGQPVVRMNLNGQTDTGELIGRFVPSAEGWRFREGVVVRAMLEGWWLILDELNLAEPQILERLNPVLESPPSLVLTEHDDRKIGPGGSPVHPRFRLFATMNPAEYAGRSALSPAWRDRWLGHRHVPAATEEDLRALLTYQASGSDPDVKVGGRRYLGRRGPAPLTRLAEAFMGAPELPDLLTRLARFHVGLESAVSSAGSSLGAGRKERYVFTRRGLLAVMSALEQSLAEGMAVVPALRSAIDRYYLQRLAPGDDREVAKRLLVANALGPDGLRAPSSEGASRVAHDLPHPSRGSLKESWGRRTARERARMREALRLDAGHDSSLKDVF